MPVAFANATTITNATATTSDVLAVPSGTTNGDLLIAAINCGSGAVTFNTPPTGWTVVQTANDGHDTLFGVWYKVAATEPASYTFSWGASSVHCMSMMRFTGAKTTSPVRSSAKLVGNATGTTQTGPGLTGVQPADLLLYVGFGGDDAGTSGDTITPPGSPWATAVNITVTSKGQAASYATGAVASPTFTASSSTWLWNSVGLVIADLTSVPAGATMTALTQFTETLTNAPALTNVATNLDTLCQIVLGKPTSVSPANKPLLKVTKTGTVSIPTGSETVLAWDAFTLSTDGMWTTGSVVTIQTAGWYQITLQVSFANAGASQRSAIIFANGTTDPTNVAARKDEYTGATNTSRVQARLYDRFHVGDTIRGAAFQNTGSALSTDLNWGGTWMTLVWDAPY